MSKWYGSINNRIDENKMYCKKIEVGTWLTEYSWSDRTPYEVVKAVNQNNVFVRELGHKHVGNGEMDNQWELFSDETKTVRELKKRYGYWNWVVTLTNNSHDCLLTTDEIEKINKDGKAIRYVRTNVSFGIGEYYYDYEF